MGNFLLRRLIRTVIVLWGVSTIVFVVTRLSGAWTMVGPSRPEASPIRGGSLATMVFF